MAAGGPQDSHALSIRRSSTNSCNGSTASDADSLPAAAAHVRDLYFASASLKVILLLAIQHQYMCTYIYVS